MSNNLYEEAISAAEQIKEAAESRVKQQLVEAMSPRIKKLIESNIIDSVEEAYLENLEINEEGIEEDPDECGEGIEEHIEEAIEEDPDECGEGTVEISSESVNILKKMLGENQKKKALKERMESLREGISRLKKAMILAEGNKNSAKIKRKFVYAYNNLLQELKNIKSSSIIKTDKTLLKEFLQLSKELNNMSRRRSRSRYLNENLEDLLEMNLFEEDEDEEEMMDDAEDEEEMMDDSEDEEELQLDSPSDSEISLGALEDMSFREVVDAALEGASSQGDSDESGEEDLEEGYFFETDESMEGEDPVEGMENMEGEDPMEGMEGIETESLEEGLFLEIDENMLKREIKNMRRLREGEAKDMASHFGGGSLEREMFVDSDEGDLNVHDGEELYSHLPTRKVESALRNAVRKNRIAEGKNKQYRNALRGMKKQLSEMNLFNAKLLYANKLMQNRDLSIKQQKHIVESLDEAGTLNEAKLLFESLSKSLSRPSRKGGNLNESSSRRVLSSSSRSVKSAQPINENVALDRWATLAGIKK